MAETSETNEPSEPRDINTRSITTELHDSFLQYAMSVISSRALPDARDGLKPSQRRILVAMDDLNLNPGSGYRKCAKISGDTSGNYHPHGEAIVYPTLVHLAQDFRMRYPLVQGQGNFGSIDGYPPAAMRYTEARLAWPAREILNDVANDTVDFIPNYDETRTEPSVLPAKFPNLLCNGSMGIAVGMATKIPPHNFREIAAGLRALIADPEISITQLMEHVRGPDFPTGGIVQGLQGIQQAYRTGRGLVRMRARTHIESRKGDRERIIVTEIPFLVQKSKLLESIADVVKDKKIDGITNLQDESGRGGLRIVIDVRADMQADVVLNQLFNQTQLQMTFGILMLALVNGQPVLLNLKQLMQTYLDHRLEVIVRRTRHALEAAATRAHLLEGLRIALDNIDEVITIIRASSSPEEARTALEERFELSERQSGGILAMRLQRLTGLERDKLTAEYRDLQGTIYDYQGILAHRDRQLEIILDELAEMEARFGDDRRSEIVHALSDLDVEDLIPRTDVVVTVTATGYVKRTSPAAYRAQHRGGRGVLGMRTKDDDYVEHIFVASTHDTLLFLTASGMCHWLKVYRIPEGDRTGRGRPLVNLLNVKDEEICAVVPVADFSQGFLLTATRNGIVKKTALSAYKNVRRDGIIALKCGEDDHLIGATITSGNQDIMLITRQGKAARFHESEARALGRVSGGVKGIRLRQGDEVSQLVVPEEDAGDSTLLTVCEHGYGKRTLMHDYPTKHRGGMGVIDIQTSERNGDVVACIVVKETDQVMIVTRGGQMIRTPVAGVSTIGRNTGGVRMFSMADGDNVIGMTIVMESDADAESDVESDVESDADTDADE